MSKPYTSFVFGKDDFTVNQFVEKIEVKSATPTAAGYEITYRIPGSMLTDFLAEMTEEEARKFKLRIVSGTE